MDNNVASIQYNLNAYYDRNLLQPALPMLNYLKFAQIKDIPTNNTDTIKFRRYLALSLITTPLIEGITPQGSKLSYEVLTAQVKQYGDYVLITEWVDWTVEDAVLTEVGKRQGEQAGQSLDALMGNSLVAGTNVLYAGTNVARNTIARTDKISETLLKNASLILKNQKAKYITSVINPTNAYNTHSVPASYILFAHPYTTRDLKDDGGFVKVKDYPNPSLAMPNEVGYIDEFRVLESQQSVVLTGAGAAGINVYPSVAVAQDSYGATRVAGKAMMSIRHPFGSSGAADALDQRGTSGWKATFVGLRLYEAHILRIEHGTSQG